MVVGKVGLVRPGWDALAFSMSENKRDRRKKETNIKRKKADRKKRRERMEQVEGRRYKMKGGREREETKERKKQKR